MHSVVRLHIFSKKKLQYIFNVSGLVPSRVHIFYLQNVQFTQDGAYGVPLISFLNKALKIYVSGHSGPGMYQKSVHIQKM